MSAPEIDVALGLLVAVAGTLLGQILRVRIQTKRQERELLKNKESMEFYAGGVTLTYGRSGRAYPFALAGFFLSMAGFMLAAKIMNDYPPLVEPQYETVTFILMLLSFGFLPWLIFVHAFGVRHLITTQGIARRSPWLKPIYATWDQIESISCSSWLDAYVLRTSIGTIRVRTTLENISYLEEMIAQKVAADRWE